jgi:hypothetical protein
MIAADFWSSYRGWATADWRLLCGRVGNSDPLACFRDIAAAEGAPAAIRWRVAPFVE